MHRGTPLLSTRRTELPFGDGLEIEADHAVHHGAGPTPKSLHVVSRSCPAPWPSNISRFFSQTLDMVRVTRSKWQLAGRGTLTQGAMGE